MNDDKIKLAGRNSCTGCGACVDVCSMSCIEMVRDGIFAYPRIDAERCVKCGKCVKVCPSLNALEVVDNTQQRYYACRHKDMKEVKSSTSGGVGIALAEYAVENGYCVAGVVLSDAGIVRHILATTKEELQAFKGSKYVQSDTTGIYKKCLSKINEGLKVLFIGTPCQTEAVKRFVPANKQDCLLTCSIICHGVNSSFVWNDYKNSLESKYNSKITKYNFRSKSHGWQKKNGDANLRVSYTVKSGKKVDVPSWNNLFHCWFGQHYIMRPSCFNCQYRTEERHSDIVIGDFWGVEKVLADADTFNGVSVLITTNANGESFLHSNPYLEVIPVDGRKSSAVLKGFVNKRRAETIEREMRRAQDFEKEYCEKGFDYMAKKYPNATLLTQIISKLKSIL